MEKKKAQPEVETLRSHRWFLLGDKKDKKRFLLLKNIFIFNKTITLTYYMVIDNIDEIISTMYPTKLIISLIDGEAKPVKKLVIRGVKFKRQDWSNLDLDYSKTDILTHQVKLTFKNIKWK